MTTRMRACARSTNTTRRRSLSLRCARANDPSFPAPAGKRGAELLYRVGDLKRWGRNRGRAAVGATDMS
ncbi:hypothetical protein ACFVYV_45795 [Streptomyces mirabilis]|uniref:hypothetical protein n=1 Tax=Streptomyces TaxID=1883 RepID=UPI0015CA7EDE|nr:hypothetical protein [Streptomyces sp. Ag82_O1-15]